MAKTKKEDHYVKGKILPAEHKHTDYLEWFLDDFAKKKDCYSILNVCSGDSTFGDVRVDINPNSSRTMHGDLFDLPKLFSADSFDLVYIDPPFEFYTAGTNRFRWQFEALKIAKKILITRRTKVNVNMPSKFHEWIVAEDTRPSITLLRVDYK